MATGNDKGVSPRESKLGLYLSLKICALLSFYLLMMGFSYALGYNCVSLSEFVTLELGVSGGTEGQMGSDFHPSILTAAFMHLGNIFRLGTEDVLWPLPPVAAGVLFLYGCFLAGRLRAPGAFATNLAFFTALLLIVLGMTVGVFPLWWVNALLLIWIPIGIYVSVKLNQLSPPDVLLVPAVRHMLAAVSIGVLLTVGSISAHCDGIRDANFAECDFKQWCIWSER